MTEDDTFNRLKRPLYWEMRGILEVWIYDSDDRREINDVLRDNHWDPKEYNKIAKRFLDPENTL